MLTEEDALAVAAEAMANARRIAVLSGAGLSKASGIPTYRDSDGLWADRQVQRFAHVDELERDPAGFSRFWARRLRAVNRPSPIRAISRWRGCSGCGRRRG